MVVAPTCELGSFNQGNRKKLTRKGLIVRQGDVIKFGRVPIMIKESSIDQSKWALIKKDKQSDYNFVMDVEPPSDNSRNQTFNQYVQSDIGESGANLYNLSARPDGDMPEGSDPVARERQLTVF